jgi:hypothetical protein
MTIKFNQKYFKLSGSKKTKQCFNILSRAKMLGSKKASSQAIPQQFCYFLVTFPQLRMNIKINQNYENYLVPKKLKICFKII